jgi:hypothetical protein
VLVRALVAIVGITDVLAGGSLLLARRWFFDTIAPFPPYSPHFLGDAGAFLLPIGVALLVAATNPARYLALLVLGAAVSLLHFLNHLYGSVTSNESWLQTFEVGVIAVAMLIAVAMVRLQARRSA